jgi:hypothetical protein
MIEQTYTGRPRVSGKSWDLVPNHDKIDPCLLNSCSSDHSSDRIFSIASIYNHAISTYPSTFAPPPQPHPAGRPPLPPDLRPTITRSQLDNVINTPFPLPLLYRLLPHLSSPSERTIQPPTSIPVQGVRPDAQRGDSEEPRVAGRCQEASGRCGQVCG